MRAQANPNSAARALLLSLAVLFLVAPAFAQMEIVDLTSPNLIGDSNLNGQPDDGPRAFTIAAKACNRSGSNSLRDLFIHVGDGVTPGTFPVAVVPVGAPYLDEGYQLSLLPGANPTRFEGKRTLAPGECIAFYFPVSYSVVDSNGDAVWGKSNTAADDLPYTFTIWGSATDTVTMMAETDTLPKTVTVRNEITANPNKVQPNPQGKTRYSLAFPPSDPGLVNLAALPILAGPPPAIAPGETITIYFERPTFGNPNQGFDLDGSPGADYDLWFQPIGERYWNPASFRLIKTQAFLFGTNCKAGGPTGLRELLIDDLTGTRLQINGAGGFSQDSDRPDGVWYLKDLDNFNCSAWDANWYSYTFIAVGAGKSRISPYQEVASGSDNEKYNGDYCGDLFGTEVGDADYDTPHLTCVPLRADATPKIDLTKTVDKMLDAAGGTLTYTVQFTNTGANGVGSKDAGLQIVDAIPANTTYVAASATCSLGANCGIAWSTDGGSTYSQVEPPAASVTHIRWSVNQTLAPAAMGTAGFQVVIDNPFTGTITNTARLRIDNGPFLLQADAETGVGLGSVHLHLFVDDNLDGLADATDSNGVQDAGEADLPDTQVFVNDSGFGMQTLGSDVNGDIWALVPPGQVGLTVIGSTTPPGYMLTTANDFQLVTAIVGTPVNGTDVGYAPPVPKGSIGDRVWRDDDANGVQNFGEPGINGVTVELQDGVCTPGATCPTQVTAGDGDYDFTMLGPATYTVTVTAGVPGGFFLTTANDPTVVNLSPGEDVNTVDFGYEPINGVIGDFVWGDQNADTIQDPAEAGLGGITLELQDGVCTPGVDCPTQVTDATGAYLFIDLPPGTYTVDVLTPPALGVLTTPPEPRGGIVLAQAEVRLDIDFGYTVPTANIGDRVWNDVDNDGVQDAGELGIDGVTVELLEVEDTTVPGGCTPGFDCPPCTPGVDCPTAVTAGGGLYLFDNGGAGYAPSQYRVVVDESSAPVVALSITTADTVVVPLAGTDFLTGDFGFALPAGTVTKHVFQDTNGNGVQDVGEPDLAGVEVSVTDSTMAVQTANTNATGDVSFTIPAGSFTCDVNDATLPPGLVLTTGNDPHGGTVPAGGTVGSNTGYQPRGTLTKHVYEDTNGNGVQDVGEPDLAGVTVNVTDSLGVMQSAATDATGNVAFNVAAGVATCDVDDATLPPGYTLTTGNDPHSPNVPAGGTVGSNTGYQPRGTLTKHVYEDTNGNGVQDVGEPDLAGVTVNVTDSLGVMQSAATDATGNVAFNVAAGVATCDVDDTTLPPSYSLTTGNDPHSPNVPAGGTVGSNTGYQPPGTLTKHIYEDTNGNGVQDVGEPDLAGVTVNVTDSLGAMQSAATNATGDVSFTVAAGVATCDVDDTTLPVGYTLTTGNDPHSPNVPPGGTVGSNTGYQPGGGTVTAHVFEDTNGNGVQDVGEPDLAGVDVTVTDSLGGMQTGTTNATGDVSAGVPPGNTTCDVVDATVPAGYVLTTANDPPAFPTQTVVAVSGTTVAFGDYGYQPRGTLTKHVYEDSNGNGVQDIGEPDLAGVTVDVTDSQGVMQSAATNATGDVSFDVAAGVATCDVDDTTLPPGYTLTTGNDPHSPTVPAGGTVGSNVGYQPPIVENPVIGVAKEVIAVTDAGGGLFDVDFSIVVENLGDVALSNVQVTDDLTTTFPAPVTFAVSVPVATGTLTANAAYDGAGDVNLLNAAGSTLAVGASGTITFTVTIDPGGATGPFFNVAVAGGQSPSMTVVSDMSDDGSDPDPDGSGDPGGPAENDPTQIDLVPGIDIPTVSEWGLLLLTLLLAGVAVRKLRR